MKSLCHFRLQSNAFSAISMNISLSIFNIIAMQTASSRWPAKREIIEANGLCSLFIFSPDLSAADKISGYRLTDIWRVPWHGLGLSELANQIVKRGTMRFWREMGHLWDRSGPDQQMIWSEAYCGFQL